MHLRIPFRRLTPAVVMAGLLLPGLLRAQTAGKIAGEAVDAATGEPLAGCNVTVEGTPLGASTDAEGAYFILNVPPGSYTIRASMLGYQRMSQRGTIVHAGRTTRASFRLAEEELVQQEVVVEAVRPDVEPEKTSTSTIIRADEVQAIAGMRDVGDVLGLAADITDGHFRGGRAGEEYYTLQGMGIVNPLDNSSAFLPIMSAVEEVEVITSGFGAQYGNAQSGVVNISMKEGRRDGWRTHLETRTRAPGRKHFGPSAYDPAAHSYLQLLLDRNVWLRGDPNSDTPQPYYGSMGSGLTSRYGGDTLVQVAAAQALWGQMRRDIGRDYGNKPDYSVEAAAGGPVSENVRLFFALRSDTQWPVFPTERPDEEYQVMGNVVTDLPGAATLRLSGGFTQEETNQFPGENGVSGYQRWLWDRITGITYRKRTNLQMGARFTQTLSPSTYYEVKLNSLFTRNRIGSTPVPGSLPADAKVSWSFILPIQTNNSPDGIDYQTGYDEFRNEPTRTITLDGSLTSQVTPSHLLNAGLQLNSYRIDVQNVLQLRGNDYTEHYEADPFEAALYVQDKMEFEGMIANAGLRFDLWSSGREYYTNLFTPFLSPDSTGRFHPEAAPRADAPVIGRLQPRVGMSFPVSVHTVFHLNYGAFMQRPPFEYVVAERTARTNDRPVVLGNPRLEPEVTNSYDVGVTQGLGEGFTLDVSGYYKDVKNLIEQAFFTDTRSGQQVSSYFNRDYADIRGFRVALSRRRGAFTGSINYQFGVATGKSANATSAAPTFNLDTTGAVTTDLSDVPIRDITLDFDRTHSLIVSLAYVTGEEWGPEVFGVQPLADLTLSSITSYRSGRPYTSPSNLKQINGMRAPGESNTNIRLTKKLRSFFGTSAALYVEVFNLFDQHVLNYDYLFQRPTSTNPNLPLTYLEESLLREIPGEIHGVDDPEIGVRYWWDKGKQGPFAVDQSFLIYSNTPRSVSVGFTMDF
ncbi:MAG: TonB-dependent receptor [Bacteroidota bacterium]